MTPTPPEPAPAVVLRLSLDFKIEFINRVLPEYEGARLVGEPVFAFAPPDQHEAMRKGLEAAKATRLPSTYESVALAPDGTRDWYFNTVGPILDGNELVGLTLICTNVTRVKQAETELKESRARLEVALDAGRVGLWRWDAIEDVVDWDDRLCAMFGLERANAPTRRADWMAIVPPDIQERMNAHIDEALLTGNYPDFELPVGVAPAKRWFIVRGGPMRGADGNITGLMGGVLEVTGLRLLEEQIRQTEKLEAVGQLSAGIAHNFNNMLAAIVPVLELAKRRGAHEDAELFDGALKSALQAAELVKELMAFSRRRSDAMAATDPLDDVIRRATELCARTFERRVQVVLGDLSAARGILVDGARTEHALLNLLVNARDAVEKLETSRRTITLSAHALSAVEARTQHEDAQGDYVELRVTDRGEGIDETTRERIFDPFFTTKPLGKGTGLGLSTAWAAAKLQNGYLTCRSQAGTGTTFSLTLPAGMREQLPRSAASAPETEAQAQACVLVIDDEPAVLRSTMLLLEHIGHQALGASSGEEGVRIAQSQRVDLVLLDRSMPGQPPEATLAQLRARAPDLPIIAFSGLANALPGATFQLTKPATGEQLERAVVEALRSRPARR
ncbi:MAG TPA: ATP-binding protein [Polyangiaceae bacterium]|nr:ATP-binding protein [Polyangiaceae bacterium]